MNPRSAAVLAAALFLLPPAVFAAGDQADPSEGAPVAAPADGSSIAEPSDNPFLPGEQTISLAAGLHVPAFLVPDGGVGNLGLGGSFSFSYQYFVSRGFAVGGNIAGAFNNTISGLSVFTMPLGATASYWWAMMPFEFSVLGEAGGFMMRHNGEGFLGPFAKAGGGAYWRMTPAWSLGLQAYLWFVPEIHYGDYASLSRYGGFVETSIAAVYHL
jgi:hypothetical protein